MDQIPTHILLQMQVRESRRSEKSVAMTELNKKKKAIEQHGRQHPLQM
jgi:hypothetical protein